MEISFIHMQMNQNLHVNKTNFHMKGFALGLALKQRRNATWKLPIAFTMYMEQFTQPQRVDKYTLRYEHRTK